MKFFRGKLKIKVLPPEAKHSEVRRIIARAKRNSRRRYLLWISLAAVILSVAGLFFVKPVPGLDVFLPGIISFCTFASFAAVLFILRYQSLRKLFLPVSVLIPLVSAVPVIAGMLTQKMRGVPRYAAAVLAVVLLVLAVSYMVLYQFNEHLLIVFKL